MVVWLSFKGKVVVGEGAVTMAGTVGRGNLRQCPVFFLCRLSLSRSRGSHVNWYLYCRGIEGSTFTGTC